MRPLYAAPYTLVEAPRYPDRGYDNPRQHWVWAIVDRDGRVVATYTPDRFWLAARQCGQINADAARARS